MQPAHYHFEEETISLAPNVIADRNRDDGTWCLRDTSGPVWDRITGQDFRTLEEARSAYIAYQE